MYVKCSTNENEDILLETRLVLDEYEDNVIIMQNSFIVNYASYL